MLEDAVMFPLPPPAALPPPTAGPPSGDPSGAAAFPFILLRSPGRSMSLSCWRTRQRSRRCARHEGQLQEPASAAVPLPPAACLCSCSNLPLSVCVCLPAQVAENLVEFLGEVDSKELASW